MKRVVYLLFAVLAVPVGLVFGWRWVLAPLLGLLIWSWAQATLKSFAGATDGAATDEPEPVPITANERTLYWCEECGTEYLLVVRGSGKPPRHCGTSMHERTEIMS